MLFSNEADKMCLCWHVDKTSMSSETAARNSTAMKQLHVYTIECFMTTNFVT